jgi:hypothetical protein
MDRRPLTAPLGPESADTEQVGVLPPPRSTRGVPAAAYRRHPPVPTPSRGLGRVPGWGVGVWEAVGRLREEVWWSEGCW